jgi:hypothetical protein
VDIKALFFVEIIENTKGTHSTKMGADSSAENTPIAPKFICPICLPKPKKLGISMKKGLHLASVVREFIG